MFHQPATEQITTAKAAIPVMEEALAKLEGVFDPTKKDLIVTGEIVPVRQKFSRLFDELASAENEAMSAAADAALAPFVANEVARRDFISEFDGSRVALNRSRAIGLPRSESPGVLRQFLALFNEVAALR